LPAVRWGTWGSLEITRFWRYGWRYVGALRSAYRQNGYCHAQAHQAAFPLRGHQRQVSGRVLRAKRLLK